VTLQIDDELIIYQGIDKHPPYAFTHCQRGAYGTTVAPHAADSQVHHLKECFGLFVPDADSSLLTEIAAVNAAMYNDCGFDMMYLDALDGESILGGAEHAWHYGSKFVFELFSRLKKPPLMEMSTFHHHLWYVRSRMGAWDHPTRGHKRFIDIHCESNRSVAEMFLPSQLGWWAIKTWTGIQGEPTFSDDIEYLCGKSIGTGAGLSIMGINPGNRHRSVYQRLAAIIRNYETLRRSNDFDESLKEQLRVPGKEFTLRQDEGETWRLYPVTYAKHKVESLSDDSRIWEVTQAYAAQPLRFRLEALTGALPYDATAAIPLIDFSEPVPFDRMASAEGVQFGIAPDDEPTKFGRSSGKITAVNQGQSDPKAAWGQAGVTFSPPLNLSEHQALGVWIYGDGKGEVLNFQMKSPEHLVSGYAERYVIVDFEGWKYFELLELESDRYSDYRFPYGNPYSIYRENVHFQQIENLSIWCNNVPLHQSITCRIAPVKALPQQSIKIRNPSLTIGDKTIELPVELETGQYLELDSPTDCKLYSAEGDLIGEVEPKGEVPDLHPGVNRIRFDCDAPAGCRPRARVTVISRGDAL
jgi:hypothetical protein